MNARPMMTAPWHLRNEYILPMVVEGAIQPGSDFGDYVQSELADDKSEWIELANLTDQNLSLDGCFLSDEQANHDTPLDGLVAPLWAGLQCWCWHPQQTPFEWQGGADASITSTLIQVVHFIDLFGALMRHLRYRNPAASASKSGDRLVRPMTIRIWCAAAETYLAIPTPWVPPVRRTQIARN